MKKVVLVLLIILIPVIAIADINSQINRSNVLQDFLSEYGISEVNIYIDDVNNILYLDKKLGDNEYEITQNVVYLLGVLSKQNDFDSYRIIIYGSVELYFKSDILSALRNSKTNAEKIEVINNYLEKIYYTGETKQKLW